MGISVFDDPDRSAVIGCGELVLEGIEVLRRETCDGRNGEKSRSYVPLEHFVIHL